MPQALRVLIVEDSAADAELLLQRLRQAGFDVRWQRVDTEADFLAQLDPKLDLVLSDYAMPSFSGLRALELLRARGMATPFILVSGTIGEDTAVEAMKRGASDYLLKDRLARLGPAVLHVLAEARQKEENRRIAAQTAQAREALERERYLLRTLIDQLPDAIYVKDAESRFLLANKAVARFMGAASTEALTGKTDADFYPAEVAAQFRADERRVLAGEAILDKEENTRVADGSVVTVLTSKLPLRDAAGKVIATVGVGHDITRRTRAEVAASRSEAHNRAILESALDCVIAMDHEGRVVEFNPAAERAFGYSRAEAMGRSLAELIIPVAMRERHAHGLARYLATGQGTVMGQRLELTAMRRGGEEFPVELAISRIVGSEPPVFTGFIRDITTRKRAEQHILELNRTYAMLSDINQLIVRERSPQAVLDGACRIAVERGGFPLAWAGLVDAQTGLLRLVAQAGATPDTVAAVERIIGDPKIGCVFTSEAVDLGRLGVCNDIARDLRTEPWRDEALKRGYRAMVSLPFIVEGRRIGAYNLYATQPDFFDEDELRLLDELAHDIAFALEVCERERERQRAVEQVRVSEERFRQLAENIHEAFWMTDPTKNEILYVSPAYEQIWGRTCASLYASPRNWIEAIHPEDRARILAAAQTKQTTGEYDETYRVVRPDGTMRWVRDKAFPVAGAEGRVHRIVGVAEDVTERRSLEEQLRRSQRLEAIGALASGIAHDLNNILAPVLMAPSMLRGSLKTEQDQQMLAFIEQGARRGADIVRQLLTFSRGTDGERVSLQLRHLLREMHDIATETFPREIDVQLDAPANLLPVLGDATQLHQVLLNLCVNARDAMPRGGTLSLRAKNALLGPEHLRGHPRAKPGPYVIVTVTDTGAGIRPEIAERIFDPFFTTKEPGQGTGLGLSTVLGIVRSHGGFITVESPPGRGATFAVHLPAAPSDAPVPPTALLDAPPDGHGELVLVVDDEPSICAAASALLESHGYRTITAPSGEVALKLVQAGGEKIAVAVTDIMMPLMNGVELIAELRRLQPGMKIVATTGMASDAKRQEIAALGVKDLLAKPFNLRELLETLQQALAR
jgi:PAS domain S-box-containing protein